MPTELPEPTVMPRAPALGTAMEKLRHRWGWFVAMGVIAVILGAIALGMDTFATITAVYIVAVSMVVAGAAEITLGFNAKDWSHFFLYVLAGLFYLVAGAFALAQPYHAAVVLTLILGTAMLVAGGFRIYIGTHMHSHARTMVIVGGVLTALVGLFIVLGWPTNSIVILGAFLGIDLLFTGFVWIGLGLRLRHHA